MYFFICHQVVCVCQVSSASSFVQFCQPTFFYSLFICQCESRRKKITENEQENAKDIRALFRRVNPGGWVSRLQILDREDRGGCKRVVGVVVKYNYILSCTGSVFESGDF